MLPLTTPLCRKRRRPLYGRSWNGHHETEDSKFLGEVRRWIRRIYRLRNMCCQKMATRFEQRADCHEPNNEIKWARRIGDFRPYTPLITTNPVRRIDHD